jgi:pyruvate dehydrogenase E2 component (dihydrolipoamide acetyltransferase)
MPKLGFDMAEGKLIRWMRAEGEAVEKGQVLAEIETDKATVEVEAAAGGVVRKHLVTEGASVPVGTPIAVIGTADEPVDETALPAGAAAPVAVTPTETAAAPRAPKSDGGRLPAGRKVSPLARRLAEERGLDLGAISGSGPGGRVVRRDIEAARGKAAPPMGPYRPRDFGPPVESERAGLSRLRTLIGRRMTQSKQQAPHFYLTAEIDAGAMMEFREELNLILPEQEKVSVNDLIVKASALALREFRNLNASIQGEEVVRHGEVNIGVAVALDEGLLTVVARDADRKSLQDLSREIREMVGRARQGRVRPEDIEGSTFSVSNMGMFDVDHFIAIINPPEAAILAVGSVREIPVVREGALAMGKRMKLTISADHRVTDGAEAARFLQVVRELLEHPIRLIL